MIEALRSHLLASCLAAKQLAEGDSDCWLCRRFFLVRLFLPYSQIARSLQFHGILRIPCCYQLFGLCTPMPRVGITPHYYRGLLRQLDSWEMRNSSRIESFFLTWFISVPDTTDSKSLIVPPGCLPGSSPMLLAINLSAPL